MKILYTVGHLDAKDGGLARSTPSLAQAVAEAGAEVRLWSARPATIDRVPYPNIRFEDDGLQKSFIPKWSPDLIHTSGLWRPAGHRVAGLARQLGIPRVVSSRGMLEPWCLNHKWFRKKIAWWIYQQRDLKTAAALHATSPAETYDNRQLGLEPPVIELPNGVTFPPEMGDKQLNDPRQLIFVGRLHPVKGLGSLLNAWAQIRPDKWKLRLFGPVENGYDRELNAILAKHDIGDSVSLEGAFSDEEKWLRLRSTDALVLPSFTENFGIVVAEALASETPVLTTTGTPRKGLVEYRCGWSVSPDVDGLVSGLRTLTQSIEKNLAAMGVRGREWVQTDFLWSGIGRQMLQAYDWLLSKGTVPETVRLHRKISAAVS